jgi:hypothetical protein
MASGGQWSQWGRACAPWTVVIVAAAVSACSSAGTGAQTGGGSDASFDATADAPPESGAGTDATAGTDGQGDAAAAAGVDAEAGPDAASDDAGSSGDANAADAAAGADAAGTEAGMIADGATDALATMDAPETPNEAGDAGESSYYSVSDATDLAAPPTGAGLQIATPAYTQFDPNAAQMVVTPNQEIGLCYYVNLPAAIDVGTFQSWMSAPYGYELTVTVNNGSGTKPANGTITSCTGGPALIWDAITPGKLVSMSMPPGVAFRLPAGTQLVLYMHFVNPGTSNGYPSVKLNLLSATGVTYAAGIMESFNALINVPAGTSQAPGTQFVTGTCTASVGSNFFLMTTRTHGHATAAYVDFVHGGASQEVVFTGATSSLPADEQLGTGTDWSNPGVGTWTAPFLTVGSGDSFTYRCTYSNPGTQAVTVGWTANTNEQCRAIGYYFPAGTWTCN